MGDIEVLPLYPRAGTAALRLLVKGRRGCRARLGLSQGPLLQGADDRFTPHCGAFARARRWWVGDLHRARYSEAGFEALDMPAIDMTTVPVSALRQGSGPSANPVASNRDMS